MTPIYQITIAIRGGKTEQSVALVVRIQKQLYSKLEFIVLDLNINYDGAKSRSEINRLTIATRDGKTA
jgi:hypothetical protein